ncbi:hypothetical protein JCM5350_004983 [Sporobolomyces pararoseus]
MDENTLETTKVRCATRQASPTVVGCLSLTLPPPQVDRFSLLPREVLDYIFELAHEDHELATVPPSKYLASSHERALYRRLPIRDKKTLPSLAASLEASPTKGRQSISLTVGYVLQYWAGQKERFEWLLRLLPNLINLEFGHFSGDSAQLIASNLSIHCLISNLRTCRFTGCSLTLASLKWLSRNPNLRRLELSSLELEEDNENDEAEEEVEKEDERNGSITIPQVTELSLDAPRFRTEPKHVNFPGILPFFPSAQLTSVNIQQDWCIREAAFVRLIELLPPTVQQLRLTNEDRRYAPGDLYIDHLLPNFPNLQHLQLDRGLFTSELPQRLSTLSNLVSLSLSVCERLDLSDDLPNVLSRLPQFKMFEIEYFPLEQGAKFDIGSAEKEVDELEWDPYKRIPALEGCEDVLDMDGWEFPFEEPIARELRRVQQFEESIGAYGIEVRSNYDQVFKGFHHHLVEHHNRMVAEAYFYQNSEQLYWAHRLSEDLNLYLPPPEIDLDNLDLFDRTELEWVQVDLTDFVGDGKECYGLTLRYREGVDTDISKREHRRKKEPEEIEEESEEDDQEEEKDEASHDSLEEDEEE